MERQVLGWADRYQRAKTKEIECMAPLKAWMLDKMPPARGHALLHNDWRLDNIMLDSSDPGRVVAVFDWDMCTLGDPLADLGCLLSLWFQEGEWVGDNKAMPSDLPGFMSRKEAVERYGHKSGKDMSRIDFYYVFGLYKMAVILQQIYCRFEKGQTRDKRFQFFGAAAELLLSLAWSNAQNSSL